MNQKAKRLRRALRTNTAFVSTFVAVLVVTFAATASGNSQNEIAVIVNTQNPTKVMSTEFLTNIFEKKRVQWAHGNAILVINQSPNSPVRSAFDRKVLNKTPQQAAEFWISRRVRGLGSSPPSISSETTILKIISRQKDAVSYVRASALVGAPRNIAVVKIDGALPGDEKYPLRGLSKR